MFQKGNKHGKKFGKGQPTDKGGRPKKLLTKLKDLGYKEAEVMDTLKVLFALGIDELSVIDKDEKYSALERTIAAAIVSGHKKRSLYAIMQIIERVFGKPKESVDHNLNGKVKVTLNLGGK
jgi:hypothetical protein